MATTLSASIPNIPLKWGGDIDLGRLPGVNNFTISIPDEAVVGAIYRLHYTYYVNVGEGGRYEVTGSNCVTFPDGSPTFVSVLSYIGYSGVKTGTTVVWKES